MAAKLPPRPVIENAPGCKWRPSGNGWEARWLPRSDLVQRGYSPRAYRMWHGVEPTVDERKWISDNSKRLQDEMLKWARGAVATVQAYDGTIRTLVVQFQTDQDSAYRGVRYRTRQNYDSVLKRILDDHGSVTLGDGFDADGSPTEGLKARRLLRWHEEWSKRGVTTAHGLMTMLRMLFKFGVTFLECPECERLCKGMKGLAFKQGSARTERLTAEQATVVRAEAHRRGHHAMALAQAFQFECTLRQKDVIGEWIPQRETGISDVLRDEDKWLRGLRWEEIDQNMILQHITSKRNKLVEVNLRLAPMVLEEMSIFLTNKSGGKIDIDRGDLPASGPVIIDEYTGLPYAVVRFRRKWREVATAAGVPKNVFNMDTRAGAISEATDSGAQLEDVRHAATHSNIATTQNYSRGQAEKTAKVMTLRVANRKKTP